jgi:hypothetical protein
MRYEKLLSLVHSVGKASLVSVNLNAIYEHVSTSSRQACVYLMQFACSPALLPFARCHRPPPPPHPLPTLQLVGEPGTAKTSTILQFLSSFDREAHLFKTITFSYLTTPQIFQNAFEVRGGAAGGHVTLPWNADCAP